MSTNGIGKQDEHYQAEELLRSFGHDFTLTFRFIASQGFWIGDTRAVYIQDGHLEPGKFADVIAVTGDPIADISELVRTHPPEVQRQALDAVATVETICCEPNCAPSRKYDRIQIAQLIDSATIGP